MSMYVVAVGVADIRRDPDPTSELVTQALMNVLASAAETIDAWTRVTLSDYEGWIRSDQLEEPVVRGFCKVGEHCAAPLALVAVITAPRAPLYMHSQGEDVQDMAYLSTVLSLLDTTGKERVQVALPGERGAWLERSSMEMRTGEESFPPQSVAIITRRARAFLGVPYLWGGTSQRGLDCSGLVQLCYRMGGYIIPRDAYQQYDFLTGSVERGALREGDLLFFGGTSITHVAMALNDHEYIHAEGQNYHRVLINSFDKRDPHYYPRLDEIFLSAKRVRNE